MMSIRELVVTLLLLALYTRVFRCRILRLACKEFGDFSIVTPNAAMKDSVIAKFYQSSRSNCELECINDHRCKSVNLQLAGDQVCELNSKTVGDSRVINSSTLVKRHGWSFISTDDSKLLVGENCLTYMPCRAGDLCTDTCDCPGYECQRLHNDGVWNSCDDVRKAGWNDSGLYQIKLPSGRLLEVFCEFHTNNSNWIVIQRRVNGNTNFDLDWSNYKRGFGDLSSNFWIGLDILHELTGKGRSAKLRVDLRSRTKPGSYHAMYDKFQVADESDKYRLVIEGYTGNAGDSMFRTDSVYQYGYSNGMQFTTHDNDNDYYDTNCAVKYHGGWWFRECMNANLNSHYLNNEAREEMSWYSLNPTFGGISFSEMKIAYS